MQFARLGSVDRRAEVRLYMQALSLISKLANFATSSLHVGVLGPPYTQEAKGCLLLLSKPSQLSNPT